MYTITHEKKQQGKKGYTIIHTKKKTLVKKETTENKSMHFRMT